MPDRRPPATEVAQTLDRGLQVLEALAAAPDGLTTAEVAAKVGIHRSITARLLTTLVHRGFAVRRRDARFAAGLALFRLARSGANDLMVVATPLLSEIADRLGVCAVLHVADGDGVVTMASIQPKEADFQFGLRVGARFDLNAGASGIAVLAGRPAMANESEAVASARERGYAVTTGQLVAGFTGVAAPIRLNGWCDASAGFVFPQERKSDISEIAADVVELANRITLKLS